MDKTELVAEWFKFAETDLSCAKNLFETMHPKPLAIICYHCQQSVEKYLKGVLVHFGAEPEKTHDLINLMDALEKFTKMPDEFFRLLNTLTQFGVRTRYPNEIEVDETQTKNAIANAEKVEEWAKTAIVQK